MAAAKSLKGLRMFLWLSWVVFLTWELLISQGYGALPLQHQLRFLQATVTVVWVPDLVQMPFPYYFTASSYCLLCEKLLHSLVSNYTGVSKSALGHGTAMGTFGRDAGESVRSCDILSLESAKRISVHTLVETSATRSTKGNEKYLGIHGVFYRNIHTRVKSKGSALITHPWTGSRMHEALFQGKVSLPTAGWDESLQGELPYSKTRSLSGLFQPKQLHDLLYLLR